MDAVSYASYFFLDKSPKLIENVACSLQQHTQKKASGILCNLLGSDFAKDCCLLL